MKLKSRIRRYIQSAYFPSFVFGMMILLLIVWIPILNNTDDALLFEKINEQGIFPWLSDRYHAWSGRMSVEFVLAVINYNMPVWRLLNACVSVLFLVAIFQYTNCLNQDAKKRRLVNWMIAAGFFLINCFVITSSVLWCTGSFYYLWTATALLWALLPFYLAMLGRTITYVIGHVPIFIASAYASYMEQPLAILVCAGLLTLAFLVTHKKRPGKLLVIQYVFILCNATVCLLSPGTSLRTLVETHWYPDFSMMSLPDLLFQAINWTNTHLVNSTNLLFFIVTILTFALYGRKYRAHASVRTLAAVPMVFMLIRILPWDVILSNVQVYFYVVNNQTVASLNGTTGSGILDLLNKMFFFASDVGGRNPETSFVALLPAFTCLFMILFSGTLLLGAYAKKEIGIISFMTYMAALASGYILFLSPTIFASTSRIFFVTDTLLLLNAGLLFAEYVRTSDFMESKKRRLVVGAVCLLAAIYYLQLFDLVLKQQIVM